MSSARRSFFTVLISMSLAFSSLVTGIQSAAACGSAPKAPLIKIVWSETGAPAFEVSASTTGESPRKIFYAYSTLDRDINKWGPWTDWLENNAPITVTGLTVLPKVGGDDDLITFAAYTQNNCGNSEQKVVRATLAPHFEWRPKALNIAEDLPIAVGKVAIDQLFAFTDNVPISVSSLSPSLCSSDTSTVVLLAPGKCQINVSFNNSSMKAPGQDIELAINILPAPKVLPTVLEDRPDDVEGFQFHVVYVEVNGFPSKRYDQSGDINNWLDLTNIWMKKKLGKEFIFDTYQGAYDISLLKSKYSTDDLNFDSYKDNSNDPLGKLREEFEKQNKSSLLGKNLLFIIDAPIAKRFCGLGDKPGNTALALTKSEGCWPKDGYLGAFSKITEVSDTIAHELIHNLGVDHTCTDPSDLMVGDGCPESFFSGNRLERTLDSAKAQYVQSSVAGSNILELKVWKDGSGIRRIPVKGACFVGEPCLVSDLIWTKLAAPLQIQELINGKWMTLKSFKGEKSGNKTRIKAVIEPKTKGIHRYREYIPATKGYRAYFGAPIIMTVLP